jgi:phosphatidylinositol N-acetylglucosaminyltransferase subunit Q
MPPEWNMTESWITDMGQLRNVEHALQMRALFRSSPHPIDHIFDRCGGNPPRALGAVNPPEPPIVFNPAQVVMYTNPKEPFPKLYCPQDSNLTVQIVLFDRPNPTKMQYMSLKPMSLALKDSPEGSLVTESPPDRMDEGELLEQKRKAKLVEKLKLHRVVVHPPTHKERSLQTILNQINCSHEMAALMQKNIGLVGVRPQRALSVSERVVESANNLWEYIWFCVWEILTVWVYPAMTRLFVLSLVALRVVGELILRILDWRLLPHHAALKDISATAQQVDIRLQQFCYWPIQYLTLRKRKVNWESIPDSNPEYIRFYNSLWLVANDIIIGIALGSYVIENANLLAAQLDFLLKEWSIKGLSRMIHWLTNWPAGLKLNSELAYFLGVLFQWVIEYWGGKISNPIKNHAVSY